MAKRKEKKTKFCPDCGTILSGPRVKRCRSCNMKMQWKRGDFGPGTQPNYCIVCGVRITSEATHCNSCKMKVQWDAGLFGTRWEQAYCENCGKPLASRNTKRCLPCARKDSEWRKKASITMKATWARANSLGTLDKWKQNISDKVRETWKSGGHRARQKPKYCIDCGKQISQVSIRCNSCKMKEQWSNGLFGDKAKPIYCIDCGQELVKKTAIRCKACAYKSEEVHQNRSEGLKRAWARGDFDYKKVNPSSLELQIANGLEQCGILYVAQYRLPQTRKVFDFFVPSASMLIEVDGTYWHNQPDRKKRDEYKTKLAGRYGFALLRIPEERLKELGALEIIREDVLPITTCICG